MATWTINWTSSGCMRRLFGGQQWGTRSKDGVLLLPNSKPVRNKLGGPQQPGGQISYYYR
jgi:hypothetical protein